MADLGTSIAAGAIGGGAANLALAPFSAGNNFLGSFYFGYGMILGERMMYTYDWPKIQKRLEAGESYTKILEQYVSQSLTAVLTAANLIMSDVGKFVLSLPASLFTGNPNIPDYTSTSPQVAPPPPVAQPQPNQPFIPNFIPQANAEPTPNVGTPYVPNVIVNPPSGSMPAGPAGHWTINPQSPHPSPPLNQPPPPVSTIQQASRDNVLKWSSQLAEAKKVYDTAVAAYREVEERIAIIERQRTSSGASYINSIPTSSPNYIEYQNFKKRKIELSIPIQIAKQKVDEMTLHYVQARNNHHTKYNEFL